MKQQTIEHSSGASVHLLKKIVAGRCPACGVGAMFENTTQKFLTLRTKCPHCAFPLGRADLGDGPAFIVLSIACIVLLPVVVILAFKLNWPLWLHAVVASITCTVLVLAMLRPVKAAFVALQYRHRPDTFKRDSLGQS